MKGISLSRGVGFSSGNDSEELSTDEGGVRFQEKVDPKSLSLNYRLREKSREVKPLSISGRSEVQKATRFNRRDNFNRGETSMNSRKPNNNRGNNDSQFERRQTSTSQFKTSIPPNYAIDTSGLAKSERQPVYFNSVKCYPSAGYSGFYKGYFIDVVVPIIKQKIFKNVNYQFTVDTNLLVDYFVDMSMAIQALYCYEVIQSGLKSKYVTLSSVSDVLVTSPLNNEARKLRTALEGRIYPKLCNQFLHWMYQPYLLEDNKDSTVVMNSFGFFWTVNVTNFSPVELDRNTLLSVSTFKDILLRINDDKYSQLRGILDASFPDWHLTVLKPCEPRYDLNFNMYWRNSSIAKCQTDVAHSSDGLNPEKDKLFYVSKGQPDGALLALMSTNTSSSPFNDECGLVQFIPPNTPHIIGYPESIGKVDKDTPINYVDGTLSTKTVSRWYFTKESGIVTSKMVTELPQIIGSGCAFNTSTESSTFRDINQVPAGYNVSTDLTVNMLSENCYMLIDHLWEIPKA